MLLATAAGDVHHVHARGEEHVLGYGHHLFVEVEVANGLELAEPSRAHARHMGCARRGAGIDTHSQGSRRELDHGGIITRGQVEMDGSYDGMTTPLTATTSFRATRCGAEPDGSALVHGTPNRKRTNQAIIANSVARD